MPTPAVFLFSIIDLFLIGYLSAQLLTPRYNRTVTALLFAAFSVASLIKHWIFYDRMILRTPLQWVLMVLYLLITFKDPFLKSISVFLAYTIGLILIETILIGVSVLCFHVDVYAMGTERLIISSLEMLCATLYVVCLTHFIKRKSASFESKSLRVLTIYALVQMIYIFILYVVFWDYKIRSIPIVLICVVMHVLSILVGVSLYSMLKSGIEQKSRAEQMEAQIRLNKEHFARLQTQYEQYRRLRHDYYNHINVIRNIADSDAREAYISDLTAKIESQNTLAYCSNPAIDSVLFGEKTVADRKGVRLEYSVFELGDISIPDTDICSVLFNLIDNAVRAAAEYVGDKNDRFVSVTVTKKAGFLLIHVKNSSNPPNRDLTTTKAKSGEHGLGISIVQNVAEKYGGSLVHSYDASLFTATCSLQIDSANSN